MTRNSPVKQATLFSPSLVGLVVGISVAIVMYFWQLSLQISVGSFVIAGYTGWLWTQSHNHSVMTGPLVNELRALPINRLFRRILRMLIDPAFWWTMIFGAGVVAGSMWFAGLRNWSFLASICGVWSLIALSLSFGLTLVQPPTSCRKCGYDLSGQLAADNINPVVRCPECGARWNRKQLENSAPSAGWNKKAA